MQILIAEPRDFSDQAEAILARVGRVDRQECGPRDLRRAFRDYDAVWVRLAQRITADLLGEAPRCRVLATATTGLDHIDLDACRRVGIRVLSLQGETEFLKEVRATAELTMALALCLLRRIPEAAESVRAGQWDRDRFRGRELFGKTAGIVGMGRLGSLVAGYLRAFGMRVLGFDPRPDFPHEAAERTATLANLLRQADLVSLHVNHCRETHRLIDARALALMRPGAVLINTSRGGVIDEPALAAALESGHLGGAALDVLDGEPDVRPDHPLVALARRRPNLLIVPHLGGSTHESLAKTEVFLAGKVVQALEELART